MTGAGLGGTMVALYQRKKLPSFDKLKIQYKERFNLHLDIYHVIGEDGARYLGGQD